ncbi:MAG: glycosyltransferase family 2 protein [Candidatus Roizmanbacteria bacterium]|nr:glycosyltransferase family 2 protein [Candidatus Roizmanbacteria bacterium]
MKQSIDLSILVLSYNTKDLTLRCLETIYAHPPTNGSYEVLVLDNQSTDGSAAAVAAAYPQVRLYASKVNMGFGKGNNYLARKAHGTVLLLLNSDIEVMKGSLTRLYECYQVHHKEVGFMGGKLLNPDKTPQPSCGPFYRLPIVFGALFLRGDYWGLTRWSPDRFTIVDWVSGACIITSKQAYNALKGFDERIFMYMEEIDLLYRARKSGSLTAVCPDAQFIHYGSASSQGRTKPILNVYKGFIYFYTKHHDAVSLFILKRMLQLKALGGYTLGLLLGNDYLKKTYGKALRMV